MTRLVKVWKGNPKHTVDMRETLLFLIDNGRVKVSGFCFRAVGYIDGVS